jgi:hypothetical protein
MYKNPSITLIDYNKMIKQQDNKCAICGVYLSREIHAIICVDHNHKTGKVRDILCRKCNSLLGYSCENIGILECAIEYLKRHSG